MAYGTVAPPRKSNNGLPLECRLYPINNRAASADRAAIVTVPFEFGTAATTGKAIIGPALKEKLLSVFNQELEGGRTYPQEGPMSSDDFSAYFLSYDLIVGILIDASKLSRLSGDSIDVPASGLALAASMVAEVLHVDELSTTFDRSHDWEKVYAFSYYIKPNYPGRSSHLCNAGFVVPPATRGLGLGGVAGKSFLSYAPRCGYRGSVFNLVYQTNEASVKIWERLGFEKVGKIPDAGRLITRADGKEDYVGAWIIYGDFQRLAMVDEQAQERMAKEACKVSSSLETA